MQTHTNVIYLDVSTLTSRESGFSFFKLPRFLLTNSRFRKLSSDAKLLYSAMLNRLSLSAQNGWEWHGLHFIYFSLSAVMELLNCSKPKASKTLKELRDSRLIDGRRGPDHRRIRYFFLDVTGYLDGNELPQASDCSDVPEQVHSVDPSDCETTVNPPTAPSGSKIVPCSGQQYERAGSDFVPDTGKKSEPDRSKSFTCTGQKCEPEQVKTIDPNKTNQNKTISYQDHLHQDARRWRWSQKELIEDFSAVWRDENETMFTEQELHHLDSLIATVSRSLSSREWFHVNGQRLSAEDVHLRLMLLDSEELSYALEYLYNTPHKARCFSAYAISVLCNAPEEAEQYWLQRVQSDLHRREVA